jgi:hypothetical protein
MEKSFLQSLQLQKNGYLWTLYAYFLHTVYNNHQISNVLHKAIMLPMRRDKLDRIPTDKRHVLVHLSNDSLLRTRKALRLHYPDKKPRQNLRSIFLRVI